MGKPMLLAFSLLLFLHPAWLHATQIDNGDGTVTDTGSGLMWLKATQGLLPWEEAIKYCEDGIWAGHDDWRLPNRNELQSLVNYSRFSPSIDTSVFPDTASYNYWSSTTHATYPENAWFVNFNYGYVYGYNKQTSYFVRPVRTYEKHIHPAGVPATPSLGEVKSAPAP